MQARCEGCGRAFAAQRVTAKWCSARCRSRARSPGVRAARLAVVPVSLVARDAVRAELVVLGVPETDLLPAEALIVAQHLGAATGAATRALVRLLREVMAEVRSAAGRPPGQVNELQARRWRRPRGVGPVDD